MPADEAGDAALNEALCALTQLNDDQVAGLDTLAGMDDDEADAFGQQVEAAWEANRQALLAAREAIDVAMQRRLEVETECGLAARARYFEGGAQGQPELTDEEKARCWAAREVWHAAKEAAAAAEQRFKEGVTAEQLAEAG